MLQTGKDVRGACDTALHEQNPRFLNEIGDTTHDRNRGMGKSTLEAEVVRLLNPFHRKGCEMDNRLWRRCLLYVGEMRERNLDPKYIVQTRRTLLAFAEFNEAKGILSAKRITPNTLREYMAQYANNSAAYQRFVYAMIRGFLMYMEHPLAFKFKYRAQGRARRVRWLSTQETDIILRSRMTPREALIVTSGLLAGMRQCEVRRLTIRDSKDALRTGEITAYAKGKTRLIPVHPEYALVLSAYLRSTDLADNSRLIPVSASEYDGILRSFGQRIGIPLSSHVLRRSMLTRLREAKVELDVISRIAGHSSLEMTQRYICDDTRGMKEAILKLNVHHNSVTNLINESPSDAEWPALGE